MLAYNKNIIHRVPLLGPYMVQRKLGGLIPPCYGGRCDIETLAFWRDFANSAISVKLAYGVYLT